MTLLSRKLGLARLLFLLTLAPSSVWAVPSATLPAPTANGTAAQYTPHKLFLKNVLPDDLLKNLGWTSTLSPDNGPNSSALPQGVNRIYAIEGDNILLVFSTVDGFNLVKEIVKGLDITPRRATLKVIFVTANTADVDALGFNLDPTPMAVSGEAGGATETAGTTYSVYADGGTAAKLYQALLKKKRTEVLGEAVLPITNETPASLNVDVLSKTFRTTQTGTGATPTRRLLTTDKTIGFLCRINGDDSIIIALTLPRVTTTRTVRAGETMVVPYASAKVNETGANQNSSETVSFVFITPTIVEPDENPKTPSTPAPVGATAP